MSRFDCHGPPARPRARNAAAQANVHTKQRGDLLVPRFRTSAAIVALVLGTCGSANGNTRAREPINGVATIDLATVWAVVLPEEVCLLGMITDAAQDKDGTIFLADNSEGNIKVIDEDGRYRHTLSRRGEGPGETESPGDIILGRAGAVGIMQRMPPKLVWIDASNGNPLGVLEPKRPDNKPLEFSAFLGAAFIGDRTVLGFCPTEATPEGNYIEQPQVVLFDQNGVEIGTYYKSQPMLQIDEPCSVYRWLDRRWAIDRDGHVFFVPERDRYLVVCRALDGQEIWSTERDYRAPARDSRAIERLNALRQRHNFAARDECDRPPVFRSLRWDARGEIWAELTPAQPEPNVIARYDILEASSGAYLRQVVLRGDFDYDRDRAFWLNRHRVLVVRIEDDGTQVLRLLGSGLE